jgi:hypothetical protein
MQKINGEDKPNRADTRLGSCVSSVRIRANLLFDSNGFLVGAATSLRLEDPLSQRHFSSNVALV